MRNLLLTMLAILAIIMLSLPAKASLAAAQAAPTMVYPDGGADGQSSQFYSVLFDEEGEAAVAVYLTVHNSKDTNLTDFTVEIPGRVRLISVIQEIEQKPFERDYGYEYLPPKYSALPTALPKELEQLSSSASYVATLAEPVEPGGSARILLYYKATGFVSESWGVLSFRFETIKIPYDASLVRVAVNVQPPMHLKEVDSKITSLPNRGVAESFAGKMMESRDLSAFSSGIRYQPGYVQQAYGLDPLESFTVNGLYAQSWLALYWQQIAGWAVGIVFSVFLLVGGSFVAVRKASKSKSALSKVLLAGLGSGLLSTLLLVLVAILLTLDRYDYRLQPILTLVTILLFIVISVILLAPPLFVGLRWGFARGFSAFLLAVGVLLIGLIVLMGVILLTSAASGPYDIARSL